MNKLTEMFKAEYLMNKNTSDFYLILKCTPDYRCSYECLKLENVKVELEKPVRALTRLFGRPPNGEDADAFESTLSGFQLLMKALMDPTVAK